MILTNREQNIISLLVCGKTNYEISKELNISIETVKKYITSILRKMNLKNRIQVVAKVVREEVMKEVKGDRRVERKNKE